MRRWVFWVSLIGVSLALLPPLLVARARAVKANKPRIHLIPDMDNQPKFKTQTTNAFFADDRAMRLPVADTVARGELRDDPHFYYGKEPDGRWAESFPVPVTAELMNRGRQRFSIYCATCHGLGGYGDGPISRRAEELQEGTWVPPVSFHEDTTRGRPHGEIFDYITNGVRTMPAYGPQIPVEDRWAIVAYLRALQRSQNAGIEDVPEEIRGHLQQE
ncbi:MAG: cytochrome c [Phycisphaerales bacterium]|nr:MAG: cytochrome c [Phycisphaerales bacterium]